ncbi:MAG: class I SAM-dependent methyltransferase [Candidatus Aenigmarchaeota archaeon]|nr:class I SAM-dependent methyltransferase [Candidatus Aenigmarchaeota archaeon]
MPTWNSIFKTQKDILNDPIPEMKNVIEILKKMNARKVLDLGCGSGRHTILLAKKGFEVYGLDNAKEGLALTRKKLKALGLKAKLKNWDCYKPFPYRDGFFDAVVSTQTINHNYRKKVQGCISEMKRVLSPGGLIFVTVASRRRLSPRAGLPGKFKTVAPNTYIPLDGHEKGIPHLIYTKALLRQDFKGFEILEACKDLERRKYCLFGRKPKE